VPSGARFSFHRMLSARQMPDKSALPSAARGAGAFKFGLPSDVRGVPGSGMDSHCAAALSAIAHIKNASPAMRLPFVIIRPILIGGPPHTQEIGYVCLLVTASQSPGFSG